MKIWIEETANMLREVFDGVKTVYDVASRSRKEKILFWTATVLIVLFSFWIPGVMYYAMIIGFMTGDVQRRVAIRQWEEMHGKRKQDA